MFLVVARAHRPGLDGLECGGGVGCGLAGRKAIEARRFDDRRVVLICDVEIDIPGNAGNAALARVLPNPIDDGGGVLRRIGGLPHVIGGQFGPFEVVEIEVARAINLTVVARRLDGLERGGNDGRIVCGVGLVVVLVARCLSVVRAVLHIVGDGVLDFIRLDRGDNVAGGFLGGGGRSVVAIDIHADRDSEPIARFEACEGDIVQNEPALAAARGIAEAYHVKAGAAVVHFFQPRGDAGPARDRVMMVCVDAVNVHSVKPPNRSRISRP